MTKLLTRTSGCLITHYVIFNDCKFFVNIDSIKNIFMTQGAVEIKNSNGILVMTRIMLLLKMEY